MPYYTGGKPMNWRCDLDWYLALIPAIVLCLVALVYMWRWHREPLSSWRGGGLGMYADINDQRGRYIKVTVFRKNWQSAQVSQRFTARITSARLNPSRSNVTFLADSLACSDLFLSQNPGVKRIRLEFWEQEFDAITSTIRMTKRMEVSRESCRLD